MGADQLFNNFRSNLRKREGGYANRPRSEDTGGPTLKGISQDTLDGLRKMPQYSQILPNVRDLTDAQIEKILRQEYFDRPQIDKLAAVPGLQSAAPKLIEQIFDVGVLHGSGDAGVWLQQSLDKFLGTDLRVLDNKTGKMIYDGIIGSKTRAAVSLAVQRNQIREVNNDIVTKRILYMRRLPKFPSNPGWIPRAQSFLM